MPAFRHIPLGQRIPDRVHAVSCSLPTMQAVIGYEEKDPAIVAQLKGGYPRFVQHPLLARAADHVLARLNLKGKRLWPTSSVRAAEALRHWLRDIPTEAVELEGFSGVVLPDDAEVFRRAKTFLQHTGLLMSSREAEDYLVRTGILAAPEPEATFQGYSAGRVKGALARAIGDVAIEDIFLANSGMNAVYAAFRVADTHQRRRGRTVWIQLGWLYLDTIALLQKLTSHPASDYVFVNDVFNMEALRAIFAQYGERIAGVITEVPTNPLIQTTDLAAVQALCRANGSVLIADPSLASIGNINVLPYCDLLVASLTKFTAPDGDVLAGGIVVNPESPFAAEFRAALPQRLEPLYSRNLDRLAQQVGEFEPVIAQINRSTPLVVDLLSRHPQVQAVHWSLESRSRLNYLKLAKTPESVGSMITFEVKGDVARVYDRLRLPKGPSFGMRNSLICPFIYLAHYDLVTSGTGRRLLEESGLNPQLLRLSVGCEPVGEILDALTEALD